METKDIKQRHGEISALLNAGDLCQALSRLVSETKESFYADLREQVDDRLVAYNYLLSYVKEGTPDPMRDDMYGRIYEEAARLNDLCADRRLEAAEGSGSVYYKQRLRLRESLHDDAPASPILCFFEEAQKLEGIMEEAGQHTADTLQRKDAVAEQIFYAVWTTHPCTDAELEAVEELLTMPLFSWQQRALLLAALTLGALQWYDADRLNLLMNVAQRTSHVELRQRALVGIALIAAVHHSRMEHNPTLVEKITQLPGRLADSSPGEQQLNVFGSIQLELYRTDDARRARECLEQKISPELQRLAYMKRGNGIEEFNLSDDADGAYTPLGKYIGEMSKMQQEGADVMLNVFTALCHAPFFRRTANWFLPYDPQSRAVRLRTSDDSSLVELSTLFDRQPKLCNTDKYAFFIGFSAMPADQRQDLVQTMTEQDERRARRQSSPKAEAIQAQRRYLHDLYRFYTLSPQHGEFVNPLSADVHLCLMPLLRPLFSAKTIGLLAGYLFDRGRYDDAFPLYEHLMHETTAEAGKAPSRELLQRYAYCAYVKQDADLLLAERTLIDCNRRYPGDDWTLRFLAQHYIRRKSYIEATALLDEALMYQPTCYDLLIEMAQCLLNAGQYAEALNYFLRAEMLDETKHDATRAIAWCHVLLGQLDKAEDYAQQMMHPDNAPIDWVNAGLVALAAGNVPEAIRRFSGSFTVAEPWSAQDYRKYFSRIEPDLLAHGYNEHTLTLAREAAYMGVVYDK
jgi:tetratricopeptide (TPR) repeat protein